MIQRSRSVLQIRVIRGDSGNIGQRALFLDDFMWNYSTEMQMSVRSDPPELWRLCESCQKTIKTCRQQKSGLDIRRPARHIKNPGGNPPGSQLNIYEFLRFCVLCFFCRSVSLRSFCSRSFCLRSSRLLGRGFFLAEAEDRTSRAFLRAHTAVLTLVVVNRC